jgi:hypothetical protein
MNGLKSEKDQEDCFLGEARAAHGVRECGGIAEQK